MLPHLQKIFTPAKTYDKNVHKIHTYTFFAIENSEKQIKSQYL